MLRRCEAQTWADTDSECCFNSPPQKNIVAFWKYILNMSSSCFFKCEHKNQTNKSHSTSLKVEVILLNQTASL